MRPSLVLPSANDFVRKLPFTEYLKIWWKSLRRERLRDLQNQLVKFLYSGDVDVRSERIDIGGNHINQVTFNVSNGAKTTKNVVFLHGYGASLGCFARNFSFVDDLKGHNVNYRVHFLDNISFALSSNPKAKINYWKPIPKFRHITLHDSGTGKVHNKYYKLIDGFDIDAAALEKLKREVLPALEKIEDYYLEALDAWRRASNLSKIDVLVGHSFGAYWSASYSLKYKKVDTLLLLSPVGMERTAYALTAPSKSAKNVTPNLDPTSYSFLSRFPLLSQGQLRFWYYIQPYLPRILKFMGPWGVAKYYNMWYSKLHAVNRVAEKLGVTREKLEKRIGTNDECKLLIEYLYNSITTGTNSDIHVKYLLSPATTSRIPLYDKFQIPRNEKLGFELHVAYGEYDFMNSEAGAKLVEKLKLEKHRASFHIVPQGGHNLYIQNPFGTNRLLTHVISRSSESQTIVDANPIG